MNQDLRLYSLSLLIVLMLWVEPVRAEYFGGGTGCPVLEIPIELQEGDVWHAGDEEHGDWVDFRDLYPYNASANMSGDGNADLENCVITANSGTYYDGANHLWVLDDNLTCEFVYGSDGDFRSGDRDY